MVLGNEPLSLEGHLARRFDPRASRLPLPRGIEIEAEVWFGGADTVLGEPLTSAHLAGAWLVDCAGEMPADFREAAAACFPRVFADLEVVPSSFDRLLALARDLGAGLRGNGGLAPLAAATLSPPARLYFMCNQGFNRSALVAGLLLRELGADPASLVDAIRLARPGALSNHTFVRLLLGQS